MPWLSRLKSELVLVDGCRRRDADGCGRDDRAPEEIADDWGVILLSRGLFMATNVTLAPRFVHGNLFFIGLIGPAPVAEARG
jgi:hypothetical protein